MTRRKNAGKGFGFMFHGSFAEKKDAKKKEKQVHGFIKPTTIDGKRRYTVMSERKNPIRRKKKNRNPMELAVMGANPHPETQEFVVHPGQTITLKVNPSAETIREDFVGRKAERYTVFTEPHMEKGDYAKLGDLMGLTFKPVHGGQVQEIGWYEGSDHTSLHEAAKSLRRLIDAPVVVASEDETVFFVAGDQEISPATLEHVKAKPDDEGLWELGIARTIVYRERKHFDDFALINYEHKWGEETGEAPALMYDAKNKRLLLDGGDYEIRPEGIVN